MTDQGLSAEGVGPDSFVTMKVSKELIDQFRQWSDPVEIKIVETPGVGTGWEGACVRSVSS